MHSISCNQRKDQHSINCKNMIYVLLKLMLCAFDISCWFLSNIFPEVTQSNVGKMCDIFCECWNLTNILLLLLSCCTQYHVTSYCDISWVYITWCHYNAVNLLQNPLNRHTIAPQWGAKFFLWICEFFCEFKMSFMFSLSSQCSIHYHDILDPMMTLGASFTNMV